MPRPLFTTGKDPVHIVQEAGSGQVRIISPPPVFDPRTVQPVASRKHKNVFYMQKVEFLVTKFCGT